MILRANYIESENVSTQGENIDYWKSFVYEYQQIIFYPQRNSTQYFFQLWKNYQKKSYSLVVFCRGIESIFINQCEKHANISVMDWI